MLNGKHLKGRKEKVGRPQSLAKGITMHKFEQKEWHHSIRNYFRQVSDGSVRRDGYLEKFKSASVSSANETIRSVERYTSKQETIQLASTRCVLAKTSTTY